MNTQSHVILNLFILRKIFKKNIHRVRYGNLIIFFGSILPDLPMVLFFIYYTFIDGRPQKEIWGSLYFNSGWHYFIDFFNSIPIYLILALFFYIKKRPAWFLFALSNLLHFGEDFFLHNDDAHSHFYPLTEYKFISSLSYWDPARHGYIVSTVETLGVLFISIYLFRQITRRGWRVALVGGNLLNIFNYLMWAVIMRFF